MGASVSQTASRINNDFTSSAYQSCGGTSSTNTADIRNVTYSEPSWCPPGSLGFNINQAAVVDATCAIGVLQKNIADAVAGLSSSAQAGLGVAVSTDSSTIGASITNKTNQTCGDKKATNAAAISDTKVTACNMAIIQNANANSSCVINALQDTATAAQVQLDAQAKGGSLLGDLFGGGALKWIIIIVVVLLAVGGGIFLFTKMKGKKKTTKTEEGTEETTAGEEETESLTGGAWDIFSDLSNPKVFLQKLKRNKGFAVLIILILVVLVVFLFKAFGKTNNPINEDDIRNLNQTITEAHQVADYQPANQYVYQPTNQYGYQPTNEVPDLVQYQDYNYGYDTSSQLDEFYKPLLQ